MKAVYVFMYLAASYCIVGAIDYNVQVVEAKERAERRAVLRQPAPIWSSRCEKKGMDVLAKQADGGRWEIRCIPRRVLAVGA